MVRIAVRIVFGQVSERTKGKSVKRKFDKLHVRQVVDGSWMHCVSRHRPHRRGIDVRLRDPRSRRIAGETPASVCAMIVP